MSNKVTIDIDFGEEKSVWTDSRVRTYAGKLKKFNTLVIVITSFEGLGYTFIIFYNNNSSKSLQETI